MRRRQILLALTAGVATSTVAGASAPSFAARLVAVLRRPASAAAVGRAYLASRPEEASTALLERELAAALVNRGRSGVARGDLEGAMAALVREDFARERVVRVEGYILSRAEARLCALAALS